MIEFGCTTFKYLLVTVLSLKQRSGKYEEALEKFESVLGSKPETDETSVACYNVACCYSKLNQVFVKWQAKSSFFSFWNTDGLLKNLLSSIPLVDTSCNFCVRWSIKSRIWRFQGDEPFNSITWWILMLYIWHLLLQRIRTDPDLANVRTAEEFEPLMKKYDESFINENAINAIKSIFGIFNKE